MTEILNHSLLRNFEFNENRVIDLDSKEVYTNEPLHDLRMKFGGLLIWQPIQAIGHLALRIFHLLSGSSFTNGKEKAYNEYYKQLSKDPSLRGRAITSTEITTQQFLQVAIDVTMIGLFILVGVAAKEMISILGVFFPLDGRYLYGKVENFFFSKPKNELNTEASYLEFFSLSAPCMQPLSRKTSLRKRRCDNIFPPLQFQYQPTCTLAKVLILREKIDQVKPLFLLDQDAEKFEEIALYLSNLRKESHITVENELALVQGKPPSNEQEKDLFLIYRSCLNAIETLDKALTSWAMKKEYSFIPFFEHIQKSFPTLNLGNGG